MMLNCVNSARGCASVFTASTRAWGGPSWHHRIHACKSAAGPCPTAVTLPSGSFFTQPVIPSSCAFLRVEALKNTPCTLPVIRSCTCCISTSFWLVIYKKGAARKQPLEIEGMLLSKYLLFNHFLAKRSSCISNLQQVSAHWQGLQAHLVLLPPCRCCRLGALQYQPAVKAEQPVLHRPLA